MCGIVGVLDLKKRTVDEHLVRKMTKTLAHRGPNGEGVYISKSIGLGHRRLSILDVSARGAQPMHSADGRLTIVFNGEIYNYLEIKKEIGKRHYASATDTEVILAAYEKWGEACLKKFNGIFSFIIWDHKHEKIFAARDRLGVKPFYYTEHGGRLYIASEMKAFFVAGVPRKPNDRVIYEYLVYGYYDHNSETFFKGIYQLMPGEMLVVNRGKISQKRYWHLPDVVRERGAHDIKTIAEEFTTLLKDAVRLQLRSDVPVGLSVSGGLDSSLLMSAVHTVVHGQKNFSLHHFTYSGKEYETEIPDVNYLAKKLGWDAPSLVEVKPGDMPALINKITWHQEQPYPGLPTIAWHKLYESLSKTETIVTLEGHGGDEMAGGYDYYFGPFMLDMINMRGSAVALREMELFRSVRGFTEQKMNSLIFGGIEAYFKGGVSADASSFASKEYMHPKFAKLDIPLPIFETPFSSFLENFQYKELMHTKLPRVLRSVDRESMAYGRELRVPLLDHRLVEFAFSLPLKQKIQGGHQRFFMREAAKFLMPKRIAETPKRSVPNPQRAWFQKELRSWIEGILYSDSFAERKYFNSKNVRMEYERYLKTKHPSNSFHIWQWINLEIWLRTFID